MRSSGGLKETMLHSFCPTKSNRSLRLYVQTVNLLYHVRSTKFTVIYNRSVVVINLFTFLFSYIHVYKHTDHLSIISREKKPADFQYVIECKGTPKYQSNKTKLL